MWQPIETAPLDGTLVDVFIKGMGRVPNAQYHGNGWRVWRRFVPDRGLSAGEFRGVNHYMMLGKPSHWMPLPDAPDA